ncbi:LANO_0E12332g1_1 [Lachancea nothofagi CBS 11611]|uniref:LANO_0E12332g1_1 n=1 Tax=Lachancea nothofagi CBS 11611 TaxID=1266666 RepID=A0A1G4JY54_9SACH|nr:LANO_0E12332g1_1 [Lachancea nothofagi CBS 11611]
MQFSTFASFVAVSGAVALAQSSAAAISQIGDGQIQATSSASTPAVTSSSTTASTSMPTYSYNTTISTQTGNGAANLGSGAVAMAGLVAAGALLI